MTPHEFLRLVPKTNCGACGHPACLAFAVAVTRGGADARGCPHLAADALAQLGWPNRGEGGLAQVEELGKERDLALVAYLQSKVRGMDFAALAVPLGAAWWPQRPDCLVFDYLAQRVELGKSTVVLDGQPLVDPRDQILLYNYVASAGGPAPTGDWIGLESLPNSISKVRTLAVYCESRLATSYSGKAGLLAEHCRRLGAEPAKGAGGAAVAAVIPVLPQVPQHLLFWDKETDDGFEARVKVLYDRHVLRFLDLESLVFSSERLAEKLCSYS